MLLGYFTDGITDLGQSSPL